RWDRGLSSAKSSAGRRRHGSLRLDPDAIETRASTWVQTKLLHLGSRDGPYEPRVDRNPRQILRQHGLGSDVEPLALRSEEQLARSDQEIVEALIAIEGEIHGRAAFRRALAAGGGVQQEMRITRLDPCLGEGHLVLAGLHQG